LFESKLLISSGVLWYTQHIFYTLDSHAPPFCVSEGVFGLEATCENAVLST